MKYKLTDEHRAQLPAWRDKWIANAMRTTPMTEQEMELCRDAVNRLYDAAGQPRPKAIVFVPSPFVLRFASGYAAAVWHKRSDKKEASHFPSFDATNRAAEDLTRASAISVVREAIDAGATHATIMEMYATMDRIEANETGRETNDATREATSAATDGATANATEAATAVATDMSIRHSIYAATHATTASETYSATDSETYASTLDTTYAATTFATQSATDSASADATADATEVAAYHAMQYEILAKTEVETGIEVREGIFFESASATDAATVAATMGATKDAADAGTSL